MARSKSISELLSWSNNQLLFDLPVPEISLDGHPITVKGVGTMVGGWECEKAQFSTRQEQDLVVWMADHTIR
ncbi:hypothetical protein C439_17383 [Haloferax mediterranei ATCC 33500]|uniref:Uncharacterized protein n=1 Tax=Haloferax mediterranei (strain ATCC 33500 / DSM 1411 / JCM 8866 / NBRC 14739 / NCIMB 2177 / R-4) TaxID=523841 RepID=M0IM58_HALMT|nr:hypothetical protein BM92_15775 [Haloferax mediterranei ATCC 33500]ELZ97117.1 hypothetical protein C439_17383 [Haloferax mediterranei ATCC 33500]